MSSPTLNAADLLDDLASINPARGGHACHTGYALSTLPTEVRAAVEGAMDGLASSSDLARVLNKHGFALTTGQIARHRRRGQPNGCKCPREAVA